MADVITQHLDVWTSAIASKATAGRGSSDKQFAYGIKKLRELILELAVRGKLVPQDSNDEPAGVLLKAIIVEKNELIKEGKIKREKPLTSVSDEEKPFELPHGWEWCYLNEVCVLENGDRSKNYPNKSFLVESGVPFVNAGHLQNGRINKSEMTFITEDRFELLNSGKFVNGDILFCLRGSLGKSAIVEGFDKGAIASSLVIVRLFGNLERYYLHNFFDSPFSYQLIRKYDNGTAQPNLSAADLGKFLVPIPPLAEQHRIVDKVDELMALCDQLEQQQTDHLAAHQTLVQTLLDALIARDGGYAGNAGAISGDQATDAAEFEQAWSRIADHFDTLFTTEASIDQLKQTLLQLAVMGKLVPQDPNDESANATLQKIIREKELLIKAKKFQNTAKLKPKNNSFIIPKSWAHVQIGEVCPSIVPNRDKPKSFGGSIPWVTLASFPENGFYLDHSSIELGLTQEEVEMYSARLIPENTVLMSCVGRFGLTAINKVPVVPNQQIHAFVILQGLVPEYLSIVIKVAANQLDDIATTTTIAYLNKTNCESIEFGFPPPAEQIRIVAKVDELMALCDTLKSHVAAAQTTQLQLADAIVEQAVA